MTYSSNGTSSSNIRRTRPHLKRFLAYLVIVIIVGSVLSLWRAENMKVYDPPPGEKGPYLSWNNSTATDTTIVISWETVNPCSSVVEYGLTPSFGTRVEDATLNRLHSISLAGLSPLTTYYYHVATTTPNDNSSTLLEVANFTTGPSGFQSFKFAVCGDTQMTDVTGISRSDWVINSIIQNEFTDPAMPLAFNLQTGDQFHYGSTNSGDIQRYFDQMRPLQKRVPIMTAVGNHDAIGGLNAYANYFHYPDDNVSDELDYYFTYANCYFLVLNVSDNNGGALPPARLAWVETRLAEAQSYNWIFVAFHVPFYASSIPESKYYEDQLAPLFARYNVTAVFTGHLHYFEHMQVGNVHYFINGGGGADLNGGNIIQNYSQPASMSRENGYLRVVVTDLNVTVETISVLGMISDTVIINRGV